jgi:ribose/xylose/arabinose/galactoside ABC-type transport system permease subunit
MTAIGSKGPSQGPLPPAQGIVEQSSTAPHAIDSRMTPAGPSSAPSSDTSRDASSATRIPPFLRKLLRSQQFGLVTVITVLLIALSVLAGSHVDSATGATVNNFWNSHTLIQTATDASFVAIMAVGATIVIISGGIDLSVGSVYALSGVAMGLILRVAAPGGGVGAVLLAFVVCVAVGIVAGALNGAMVVGLRVHPFIITLGTMWILRGIAFVASKAESILLPESLTRFAKSPLGLGAALYPVPMLCMLIVSALGAVYLQRTVMGRHVFALGGNAEASRFSGLRLGRIQVGVYVLAGLTAGLSAFLGSGFYGSVSCGDATGYE